MGEIGTSSLYLFCKQKGPKVLYCGKAYPQKESIHDTHLLSQYQGNCV